MNQQKMLLASAAAALALSVAPGVAHALFVPEQHGAYRIMDMSSDGRCITALGNGVAGEELVTRTCDGSPGQSFEFLAGFGENTYQIRHVGSGLFVTIRDINRAWIYPDMWRLSYPDGDTSPVILAARNDSASQLFTIGMYQPSDVGTYGYGASARQVIYTMKVENNQRHCLGDEPRNQDRWAVIGRDPDPGIQQSWEEHEIRFEEVGMTGLQFKDRDTQYITYDWDPGFTKAHCPPGEGIMGLSRVPGGAAFSALCAPHTTFDYVDRQTLRNGGYDQRPTPNRTANGQADWSPGNVKMECGLGEYVSGISQSTSAGAYQIHGLQCAAVYGESTGRCTARSLNGPDDRATTARGDWAFGDYKAECGPDERMVGVSVDVAANRPQQILCCADKWSEIFAVNKTAPDASQITFASTAGYGGTSFKDFPTPLGPTGNDGSYSFAVGDYNRDGWPDLYAIEHGGSASGYLSVHVVNGNGTDTSAPMRSWLLNASTPFPLFPSDGRVRIALGDANRDGHPDLYIILKSGTGTHTTEVHVLDGATEFQTYLLETGTALAESGTDGSAMFAVADYNHDGIPDLWAILKSATGTNTTEVHVLNGADGFSTYLLHTGTAVLTSGTDETWQFGVRDFDHDGSPDLYAFSRDPTFPSTRVAVLSGASSFQNLLDYRLTNLPATGGGFDWVFGIVP